MKNGIVCVCVCQCGLHIGFDLQVLRRVIQLDAINLSYWINVTFLEMELFKNETIPGFNCTRRGRRMVTEVAAAAAVEK